MFECITFKNLITQALAYGLTKPLFSYTWGQAGSYT